jgi:hypothetical protein
VALFSFPGAFYPIHCIGWPDLLLPGIDNPIKAAKCGSIFSSFFPGEWLYI